MGFEVMAGLMGKNAFNFWDNQLVRLMTGGSGGSWINIVFVVMLIVDSLGLVMISVLSTAHLVGGNS